MKGFLKPKNERYLVNEEKGVVTYFIDFEIRNVEYNYFEFFIGSILRRMSYKGKGIFNTYTVTGISKLSPGDTFDLTKGIQIARNRAEIKLAQVEQMIIRILCKELGQLWDYTSALYNNRSEMIKEKKQFIKNV